MIKKILKWILIIIGWIIAGILFGLLYSGLLYGVMWFAYSI